MGMADCKACGACFSSTAPSELCPTCERALKRLNGYAVPVVRCKDCKCGKPARNTVLADKVVNCALYDPMPIMRCDDFCSYGERREGE